MVLQQNKLNPFHQETMSSFAKYLVLAGLLCVALFAFNLYSLYDQSREHINLLANFRDPDYSLLHVESNSLDDTWTQATMTFMMKDYQKSLRLMNELADEENFMANHTEKYHLMKGVAYLRTQQHLKAEEALDFIPISGVYHNHALWYSAINYIQQSKIDLGKQNLRQIIKAENHPKQTEAATILEGMNH